MPTRKIREVIRNRPMLLAAQNLNVREACRQMVAARVGSIMVVDEQGLLVGIFTERDLLVRVVAAELDPDMITLTDVMTPRPQTVSPDMALSAALHLMHDGCFRHMPVVEQGRPVGMVSVRDALGAEVMRFEHELEQRELITELL